MAESKDFCKATWAQVEKGDVVLMAWQSLRNIVEVEIARVDREANGGGDRVMATFDYLGHRFERWSFNPESVVYVRSRL
jgi:hypothetical protein